MSKSSLERFDFDILFTTYDVYSLIKNKKRPLKDCTQKELIAIIESQVDNRTHFENNLIETQRKRNIEKSQGVKWFQKQVVPEHYDIYLWEKLDSPN
jgi:hypothetical protein